MKKKKETVKKKLVQLSSTLYADKSTYDKVHRHLSDINDTITEEDIKNVSTDIVATRIQETAKVEELALKKDPDRVKPNGELSEKDEENMYEEGEKITSSWNVLSE